MRDLLREALRDLRDLLREALRDLRDLLREALRDLRDAFLDLREDLRDALREAFLDLRAALLDLREAFNPNEAATAASASSKAEEGERFLADLILFFYYIKDFNYF